MSRVFCRSQSVANGQFEMKLGVFEPYSFLNIGLIRSSFTPQEPDVATLSTISPWRRVSSSVYGTTQRILTMMRFPATHGSQDQTNHPSSKSFSGHCIRDRRAHEQSNGFAKRK